MVINCFFLYGSIVVLKKKRCIDIKTMYFLLNMCVFQMRYFVERFLKAGY